MATGMTTDDAESPSPEDTDNSNDEVVASDGEVQKEVEVCPSFIHDHRLQRSLLQFEDDEELDEAAVEAPSLSLNLIKFMGDMCGWVPDPSVQHRRQPGEKAPPKAGTGRASKVDAAGGSSASRRLSHHRNTHATNQQTVNVNFEFKHYSNIRKYSEQYRRYHTCGGPLQKLTQSAFGRSRTIYYAGDATADAGVEVGSMTTRGGVQQQQTPSTSRTGPGLGVGAARGTTEMPNSINQPIVTYSDISVNSPRYNLISDAAQKKRGHPTMNWTHLQKNGTGQPGSQPWNIGMNDQTLTVYTSRAPVFPPPLPVTSSSPPKPHLPYFPSQQPLKQLPTAPRMSPGSTPTHDLLQNGYSLDKTLGTPGKSCSTGISLNPGPHRDFYTQLMHAAHCLRLANYPSDFDIELPRWPTLTTHPEITSTTSSQHHTPPLAKKFSQSTASSHRSDVQVHMKGRGVNTSPTQTTKSASRLHDTKHLTTTRKTTPVYSLTDPTSSTKETHFITIEAPTCSPFDTRSAPSHSKRTSTEADKTSYRVTLKEKQAEERSSVDIVANTNRPLAVCEVAWF